ncbi:MAG: Thymidylate kinase [Pleopsidium flavum]|nr:MAG: Thymidylate kinase [Pleopsidium flavum]
MHLFGEDSRTTREEDRSTPIGTMIDAYLKGHGQQEDHVIHLLFSANRWEAAERIKAEIASGTTVVVDRYYYSGIVYSAAKDNPSLTLAWAREPEVGLPQPDICIFLDISPLEAAKRGGFGLEKYENDKTQGRVRELFQKLLTLPDKEDFCIIEADKSMQEIENKVVDAVLACVRRLEANDTPLRDVLPWPKQLSTNDVS